jgi:hypothetical protein
MGDSSRHVGLRQPAARVVAAGRQGSSWHVRLQAARAGRIGALRHHHALSRLCGPSLLASTAASPNPANPL